MKQTAGEKQIQRLKKQVEELDKQNENLQRKIDFDYISFREKDAEIKALLHDRENLQNAVVRDQDNYEALEVRYKSLQKQFRDEMQIQETRLEAIAMMIQPSFESGINPETVAIAGHMLNVIQSQITAVEKLIEKLPS